MIPDQIKAYAMDELQESLINALLTSSACMPAQSWRRPFAPTWSTSIHFKPMLSPGWRSVLLHWVLMSG